MRIVVSQGSVQFPPSLVLSPADRTRAIQPGRFFSAQTGAAGSARVDLCGLENPNHRRRTHALQSSAQAEEALPPLKILTYPRGFNPVVFWNNPFVDGITFTPGALYGDDCCEGSGHNIQLKIFILTSNPTIFRARKSI